jgi:hypothetical protein
MSEEPDARGEEFLVVDSPYEVARWRPLANVVLAVPHLVIASALGRLANVVFAVYWLAFLFTGKLNPGMYSLMTMSERYNQRSTGFLVGWSERYPPFDFTPGPNDDAAYRPITLDLPNAPTTAPRTAALNILKAIPHYFVLLFYAIGAVAVAIAAWFAVLFTGTWPHAMRNFLVRFANYYYRVWSYVTMVATDYPRFGLAGPDAAINAS